MILTFKPTYLKPKGVSQSLSKILFQRDANRWFSLIGNGLIFLPDSSVVINWPYKKGVTTNFTEDHLFEDLRENQVKPHFQKQMESIQKPGHSVWAFIISGFAGAVLEEVTNNSNAKQAFLSHIMDKIRSNIQFHYS